MLCAVVLALMCLNADLLLQEQQNFCSAREPVILGIISILKCGQQVSVKLTQASRLELLNYHVHLVLRNDQHPAEHCLRISFKDLKLLSVILKQGKTMYHI